MLDKKIILLFLVLPFMHACKTVDKVENSEPVHVYKKAKDVFIKDLISKMTLEEKIGQMTLFTSDWDVTGPVIRDNYEADIKSGKVGAIFNAHTADYNKKLQKMAIEETRLGVPLIFGYDVIHGYKTIFPVPLGESASWDLAAIENSARVAADEASAAGLHWTFAPMVDIARDPRWGRVVEGAGEDTYLGSLIAAARVKGFQGDDLSKKNTLAACAKHFAAYGAAQAGRDYHTVDISNRTLHETYLPPFKAAKDAGVRTFMTSFNELDGIPASASKYLLTDILREQWAFDGFVVTDYTSINEMVDHGYSADFKQAGEQAINAGVDMDMQGAVFYDYLKQSVEEGKVKESDIDRAVYNILAVKYELGLFEDPYRYSNMERQKATLLSDGNRAAARDMARKSIVLLKNEFLVMPICTSIHVGLIGPFADSKEDLLGSWHGAGFASDCVSLKEGWNNYMAPDGKLSYAKGSNILEAIDGGIEEALAVAEKVDVVMLTMGEAWWMSGEAASRTQPVIPEPQMELFRALRKYTSEQGKPLVVILYNGRPLCMPEVAEQADAIIETWFAGTEGGNAITEVLIGDYNPTGKLPITFPRNVGQIPIHYNMKNTGRPFDANDKYTSKYLDAPNTPLYPFGYGLSYTTFEYGKVQSPKTRYSIGETMVFEVGLKNIGDYEGGEIVQLYIHDKVASITRPVKELKAFQKVNLKEGESKVVQFELTANDLKFLGPEMKYIVEPGKFEIFIGGDSSTENSIEIELIEN